jgi:hypothetical protein
MIIFVKNDMPLLWRSRTGKLFINHDSDVFIPYFHHYFIHIITPLDSMVTNTSSSTTRTQKEKQKEFHHQKHRTKQ